MPSAESNVKQFFTRKVGPAPMWAWIGTAIIAYLVYRKVKTGSATSSGNVASTPLVSGGSGSPAGSGGGSSGGGSPADNVSGDQLAAGINSDLTAALINAQNGILGLGGQALGYNGQLEQSIIDSYFPSAYSANTAYGSAGYAAPGAGPTQYSPAVQQQQIPHAAQTALQNISYSPATVAAYQGYSLAPSITAQNKVYTVSGYGF